MRFALWLLAIFAAAVGVALFATRSTGTVTLFWPPHRIDLSLNLALLLLAALFALLYLALRALGILADLPAQAKAWRQNLRQNAMHAQLRDAMAQLLCGRFARAKKQALLAHDNAQALSTDTSRLSDCLEVQAMALLIAAEASHSMQDAPERERLVQAALQLPLGKAALHFQEGAVLRSARWVLDENDPIASLQRMGRLTQGAQRRTLALRLKLRALQQAKRQSEALETARLLAKHGGFSAHVAQSILRSLAISSLNEAHDADQITRAWTRLSDAERAIPEVATHAAARLINLSVDDAQAPELTERARAWIEPLWQRYPQLGEAEQVRVVRSLEASFAAAEGGVDPIWLQKIETAQRQLPHDLLLQYLAGMACYHRQLWGKAQQHLDSTAPRLKDTGLQRKAYRCLAELAEQRGDAAAALAAWKRAAA